MWRLAAEMRTSWVDSSIHCPTGAAGARLPSKKWKMASWEFLSMMSGIFMCACNFLVKKLKLIIKDKLKHAQKYKSTNSFYLHSSETQ